MIHFIIWLPNGANSVIEDIGEDEIDLTASQYAANNVPSALLVSETTCAYAGIAIFNYDDTSVPECVVDGDEAETEQIFGGLFPQKPK